MAQISGVSTPELLSRAMAIAAENHFQIANNIANVNTPGFTPTHVNFDKTLQNALSRFEGTGGSSSQMLVAQGDIVYDSPKGGARNDMNRVDIDFEMTELAKNSGKFRLYTAILNKHFSQVKGVLRQAR